MIAQARPLILLPLISMPLLQIAAQWLLDRFTPLPMAAQWWLAGVFALSGGVALLLLVERIRQRRRAKPLRQLAAAIRQRAVNRHFHKPLESFGEISAELVDEINRLLRLFEQTLQQQSA